VLDFTGTMTHYMVIHRALSAAALSEAKVQLVAATVDRKCDALDGVADHLIADPRRCDFNPANDLPRCTMAREGETCFTDADLASLGAIYGGIVSKGQRVFPGYPIGGEASVPTPGGPRSGWDPWLVRAGQATVSQTFMEAFFKNMATPGTEIDWRTFDVDRDLPKLEAISALLNATEADLNAFRARGGRLLMYYGWADPALTPLMGVNYYERVLETMGPQTPDFFRLFMLPGVLHCTGGLGPDRVDTVTPLVAWVERKAAPDRLVAARKTGDEIVRTRPLCPYPQMAKYTGQGSIDEAERFVCAAPENSTPSR